MKNYEGILLSQTYYKIEVDNCQIVRGFLWWMRVRGQYRLEDGSLLLDTPPQKIRLLFRTLSMHCTTDVLHTTLSHGTQS